METKLVLVDDSLEALNNLKSELEKDRDYKVVGSYVTADEALNEIDSLNADVIITDVVLKGVDGFEFIEKLKEKNVQAKIIVTSALSHESFVTKAMNSGVSYYMVKPFSVEVLKKRIKDILSEDYSQKESSEMMQDKKQLKQLEEKITNIFITVGIPAHIKGYQFLREAIKMAIDNPEIINSITKKLYPSIAQKFETSPSKVERAIRHAIEVAWNRGKIENINTLFGVKVYSNNEKPTNGEFIALVADKMLLEGI